MCRCADRIDLPENENGTGNVKRILSKIQIREDIYEHHYDACRRDALRQL